MIEMNFTSNYLLITSAQNRCSDLINFDHEYDIVHETILFGKAMGMIILSLLIIIGNSLVILAIIISSRLRTVTNFFIASLAVSDFVIGVGVLPFSFTQDLLGIWIFGYVWCRIWLALDVWVSTASIYNLVVIALDRYVAVTKPLSYRSLVTPKKATMAICGAWIWSFLVSFPPMVTFQNNATSNIGQVKLDDSGLNLNDCQCTALDNSEYYIVFSASSSFYLPFITLLYIYIRIYTKIRQATAAVDKGYMKLKKRQLREQLSKHDDHSKQQTRETYRVKDGMKIISNRRFSNNKVPIKNGAEAHGSSNLETMALRVHRGKYNAARSTDSIKLDKFSGGLRPNSPLPVQSKSNMKHPSPSLSGSQLLDSGHSEKDQSPEARVRKVKSVKISGRKQKITTYKSIDSSMNVRRESLSILDSHVSRSQIGENDSCPGPNKFRQSLHERYDRKLKREVRAAKTVALVTGCFFVCWSGFCIVYSMKALPFCHGDQSGDDGDSECVPSWAFALVLWLGYTNSALNPFIYAVCNRQFRRTFKRILCCSFCDWHKTLNGGECARLETGQLTQQMDGYSSSKGQERFGVNSSMRLSPSAQISR